MAKTTNNQRTDFPFSKPEGKNSVPSLSLLFNDRKYYSDFAVPYLNYELQDDGIFCNLQKNNALFGIVDKNLNVIYPIQEKIFMKEIPSGDNKPKLIMDFVADAFNEMNSYLKTGVMINKMSQKSVFYDLKCYSGLADLNSIVQETQNDYASKFVKIISSERDFSSKITDAKTFNKKFIEYLLNWIKKDSPVTKSSIILSANFFNQINGLTIDIAKDKGDDDKLKYEKYFLDKDFNVFVDACKRFGFLIDSNIPWRIIPDFNSPAMKERIGNHVGYMIRYGFSDLNDLFSKRYNVVFYEELDYLKNFFYNSYRALIKESPYYQKDLKNMSVCQISENNFLSRPDVTLEEYKKTFSDLYWIRVYVYLRNYEEKRNLKQQDFENIVREASNYLKANKKEYAMAYVNNFFKKFKNVYYFSSLQNNSKQLEQSNTSKASNQLVF
jgi:hypothetical protein